MNTKEYNVELIKNSTVIEHDMYNVSRKGRKFNNIKAIYEIEKESNTYWHICFGNGTERDYLKSELEIQESCLVRKEVRDVFEYLKQISWLNDMTNEEKEKLLPKRYERIKIIGEDVVLARYLNPQSKQTVTQKAGEFIPIFPFGCNKSQYQAVQNAMENQISVIQGPPGTGKTQTILNIIANILLQGKTALIVSNNNPAIKNVYEKMESYNLEFVLAILGNSDNKDKFIDGQKEKYPKFKSWKLEKDTDISLGSIRQQSLQLKIVYEKQEELAVLKQELAQLQTERKYFDQYLQVMGIDIDTIYLKENIESDKWLSLWMECQTVLEKNSKIGLLLKLRNILSYGIYNWNFYKQDLSKIIAALQGIYYKSKEKELSNRISEISRYLAKAVSEKSDSELSDKMREQSMKILKDFLSERYNNKEERTKFSTNDLWKNPNRVLEEYPVILSTTFSSASSLNGVVYDYLIMDEASQVDVATGALALSCSKNAVIVGDTKQLPNVLSNKDKRSAENIFNAYNIHTGYQFIKSFLQSILEVIPDVPQTLLKEHYRCHPKIINFCNQKFYNGELIIMTKDEGENDVLRVVKSNKGNHARHHISQRQIDIIKEEIIPKYVTDLNKTGIIAPYKDQAEALAKEFKGTDITTVHKFQGREKDTIIISTVDDEITDFADDPYLLNVAVSRAKKKLMLVVSGNEQKPERNISDLISYIQYNNFEVEESKIFSIFDYLYEQYTEAKQAYLAEHEKVSEQDSENLMHKMITDTLKIEEFSCLGFIVHFPMNMLIKNYDLLNAAQYRYAKNAATHFDFLIYNKLSKKPVLVVEVDGYTYHKVGTKQHGRDILKDSILDLYGIPYMRFQTNGSGEEKKLIEKLHQLVN